MVKKLISVALGTGMVLATVVPAFAANLCANQTTGPSSINVCTRTLTKTKSFILTNAGSLSHAVRSVSNSGNNTANNNTSGGTVSAGGASAVASKQASLNTGTVTASQSDSSVEEQGLNDTTGPNSENVVTFATIKKITLGISNNGTVSQSVSSTANSGGNSASNNTVGGTVTTGAASVDVSLVSIMNDFVIDLSQ